jgi:hypothetical protein
MAFQEGRPTIGGAILIREHANARNKDSHRANAASAQVFRQSPKALTTPQA